MTVTVELNWDLSPTDPDDVDGQRIYRTTDEDATFPDDFTQIAELADDVTTHQDDAPSGEDVTYAVTAFNDAGESDPTTTTIETGQTFERSVTTGASGVSSSSRDLIEAMVRSVTTGATGAGAAGRTLSSKRGAATGATGASTSGRAVARPRSAATGSAGASASARSVTRARTTTTGATGASASSRVNAVVRAATTGSTAASSSSRAVVRSRSIATGSEGGSTASRVLQFGRSITTGASGASAASALRDNWRLGGVGLRVTAELEAEPETLSVAAPVPRPDREQVRDLGDRAGDLTVEAGFGGAFRAVDRSGGQPIDLEPPETDPLPFPDVTPVFVSDFDETQFAPDGFEAEFELQRVRNRDDATDVDDGEELETGDDWTLTLEGATVRLSDRQVGQLEREGDTPGATVTLPLILSAEQAAALLDTVGYPAGVVVESVPDGPDQRVDETGGRQTVGLEAPAEAAIDDGEWFVTDWTLTRWSFSEDREWRVELVLAEA